MIARKQYPNHHVFETEIGGRAFTVETGKVAELADAECICRYGDTVVLTTVTCNPIPKAGIDYFPLTIEFEERMYSVGRIPGSFNRREGRAGHSEQPHYRPPHASPLRRGAAQRHRRDLHRSCQRLR